MQRNACFGIGSHRSGTAPRSSEREMMSILPCIKLFSGDFHLSVVEGGILRFGFDGCQLRRHIVICFQHFEPPFFHYFFLRVLKLLDVVTIVLQPERTVE